ncbi:MAG: exonuclease SbcCD subunit D [Ruminococcus sp.]|nr:exonuclease SbcCD subunit D [Ruminococcus sp.]
MKFAHISDLHIGKRLCGFSLIEDQRHILSQITDIIEKQNPDGVIIAGDVYDKSNPSAEAVTVFDEFLTDLSGLKIPVYIISGNHDSAERLAFGGKIMQSSEIYISPVYDGGIKKVVKTDEYGDVNIYLCPFVKPANVKTFYPDDNTDSYTEALKTALSHCDIDDKARNILVCHQFITGAQTCDSEEINVGTLDNIDAGIFDSFDYVALGHIHGAQKVLRESIRYCGTPLKYSFSECRHKKSVTMVDIREKNCVYIETVPLEPLRDLREIKGTYEELMSLESYAGTNTADYLHVTLTDEEDVPNALEKMRSVYKNIMQFDYDNKRTRETMTVTAEEKNDEKSPLELLEQLYFTQNNSELSEVQRDYVTELIERIWGESI